ncbi:MAG: HEAT repeat domain-containing protein [Desulfarculaceae bacterium]|jgi:HEAT repeat protein
MNSIKLEQLLDQLSSPDPVARRQAVAELGTLRDNRAVVALLDHLADGDPEIEDAAAQALVRMKGREVASRLVTLLGVEKVNLRNHARELLRLMANDAPDLIYSLMDESDNDLRIFAAELLENVNSPLATRVLIKTLEDPEPNVRAAAAISLGRRGETSSVSPLIRKLDDEEWVRFAVVEALAEIGDASAVEPLLKTMENGSELTKAHIAEALGRFSDPRTAGPLMKAMRSYDGPLLSQLIATLIKAADQNTLKKLESGVKNRLSSSFVQALADPMPKVRADALLGLSILGDITSVESILELARKDNPPEVNELIVMALVSIGEKEPLIKALADSHPQVVLAAIGALSRLGGEDIVGSLIPTLGHQAPAVRRLTALSLGQMSDPRAVPALINALEDEDPEVRGQVIKALGRLGDGRAVPSLAKLLSQQHPQVSHLALEALVTISGPEVRNLFIKGLSSQDPACRELCARGLGRQELAGSYEDLLFLIDDADVHVRRAAVSAILACGDPSCLDHLAGVLEDPATEVRATLVNGLAQLNHPECKKFWLKALEDPSPEVRLNAVKGLGRTGAPEALEPLLELIENPDPHLRKSAALALGEIGASQATDRLMALLSDPDPQVRSAALAALQQIEGGWG